MGLLIRSKDWSKTALGPLVQWPQSLKTAVSIVLGSPVPLAMLWGSEGIMIYNDAYAVFAGERHPFLLGSKILEGWPEVAGFNQNVLAEGLKGNILSYKDQELILHRRNRPEEVIMDLNYSPIVGETGEPAGILSIVVETTQRVISERQQTLLNTLSSAVGNARTVEEVCSSTVQSLQHNRHDVPFAMLYLLDSDGMTLHLAGTSGIERTHDAVPAKFVAETSGRWPVWQVIETGQSTLVEDIDEIFNDLPAGVWKQAPKQAVIVPILRSDEKGESSILIIGLNPYRLYDDRYQAFIHLIAGQVGSSMANAIAYEEEKKGSENQMRLITNSIPALISYVGTDQRYHFVNKAYEKWFGLSSDRVQGKLVWEIVGEDAYLRSKPYIESALSGETVTFENTLKKGDDTRHLITEYVPDKLNDGSIRGIVVLGHDITFQKKAEKELHQTQAQLQSALAAGSIDVWVINFPTSHVVVSGERLAHFFDVDPEAATTKGLPLEEFIKAIHPEDKERVENLIAVAIETGENYEAEYRVIGSENNVRWVVARGKVEYDSKGNPLRFAGALVDITERKKAEDAVKESEERFQLIARATNDVIWDWDFTANKWWWNEAMQSVFGYKREDYSGDIDWWKQKLHPDDREMVERKMDQVINGDEQSWSTEYRFLCADGSYAEVLDRGYIMRDASGKAIRMVGAMQDMTDRKRAEQALRRSEHFMKLVTDSLPVFISYVDTEERYLFANSAYERWFDMPKEQVVGKTMKEVLEAETYDISRDNVKRALAGEYVVFENVVRTKDKERYVQLDYVPDIEGDGSVKGFVVLAQDITAHKQAEDVLRKSEEYYKTMTDNTPVMTWLSDANGECTYMNKQWFEYTGQSPDNINEFDWLEPVHPDDLGKSVEIYAEALKQQIPFSLEYRLKGKKGEYRWHIDTGLPKFDDHGKLEGFVGSVIDIHERKIAEEALKVQSERFKLVVESSPSALVMVDERGRITMVNSQTIALFGYSEDELIGESLEKLVPVRFRGHHPDYRARFRQKPSTRPMGAGRDLYALRKDGLEVPVEIALNPIETEEGLFVLSSIVDITERKKAEQALRESEEFSRTLLESTPDCVKALDIEGRLLSINSQGLLMLDIDNFSAYRGMPLTNLWKGDYHMLAVMSVEKARHGHLGHFQGLAKTAKGKSKWWDVLVAPVYGAGGTVERLVAVSRDITKLKELEQQKDDFIGIASHELKTPVTSIKAYVQVLEHRIQKTDDALSAEMLTKMDGQLNRLTNLIADLLDVTRIEQGRLRFRKETFQLNKLVNEVVDDIQRTSNRHEIVRKLAVNTTIRGDRDRIGQVITNFLTNAIKYSPKATKVIVKTEVYAGREIILSVQDFGLGLCAKDCEKVFQRFYRVEESGHETYPGLGLGLYIAAGIIQRHKGKVWVESEKGEGSTFYFSLPLE